MFNYQPTLKFTFNILILLTSFWAFAQEEEDEKSPKKTLIKDVKVAINVLNAGRTFLGSGQDSHEGQVVFASSPFDLVFDYGVERNLRGAGYSYESDGSYIRVGIDKNFVQDDVSGNVLSLGLRYANASFDEFLNATVDNGFGEQTILLTNSNVNTRWFELTFNLRGKVVSNLYTGFTLRWKFGRLMTGEGTLKSFDIPGFGTTKRQNATSFDYYLAWRIPFLGSD